MAAARAFGRFLNRLRWREREASSSTPQPPLCARVLRGSGRISKRRTRSRQSSGPSPGRSDAAGALESLRGKSQVRPTGAVAANIQPVVPTGRQRQRWNLRRIMRDHIHPCGGRRAVLLAVGSWGSASKAGHTKRIPHHSGAPGGSPSP